MQIFTNEQTAIDAEQWICDKATELGMGFSGTTERFAIPRPEREPLPPDSPMDAVGEPTGNWLLPNVPDDVIARIPQDVVMEYYEMFSPEMMEG